MDTRTTCPVCYAARHAGDEACGTCGFVFASAPAHIPAPATSLTCPCCLAPQCPSAKVCCNCGEPLTVRDLRPHETLDGGRYVVQRSLARGGMGAIYLAIDQQAFGRQVVIKALLEREPQLLAEDAERLRAEGRLLAALRHSNLPQMYGYFEHGAQRFLAMEYVGGPNLHEHLSQYAEDGTSLVAGAAYPIGDVLRWGVVLARTLEYLHGQSPYAVIHQDIKPANLVLDRSNDMLFLIDLGNARLLWPNSPAWHGGAPDQAARRATRRPSSTEARASRAAMCTRWPQRSTT